MIAKNWRRRVGASILAVTAATVPSCEWRGVNSLPLPGTEGNGPGAYVVQAQLANVSNIQPNSRVRVSDVTVGNVTKIERQGWHALVTMKINGDVNLPANATAKIGQTSLLGALHIELAPPADIPAAGLLHDGSLIPLSRAGAYPTTEQTLSAASMLLNGGGLGKAQDISKAFATAFAGRENTLRGLLQQLDEFTGQLDAQKADIIAATESFNDLVGQFADQDAVIDRAFRTIPDALTVVKEERGNLVDALDGIGKLSALAADAVNRTRDAMTEELNDLGPVLKSLADAGPALTRSLSWLTTFPFPKENVTNFVRGDAANATLVLDLTLSRLDSSFFTGTRWEGHLTQLEMQWGRTIGQLPSPVTAGNPLVVPYHHDQGP